MLCVFLTTSTQSTICKHAICQAGPPRRVDRFALRAVL